MIETMLGAQMYTVRQYTQTEQDYLESLKKVKAAGYHAVQLSGASPAIAPQTVRHMLDDLELIAASTHVAFDTMLAKTDEVIAEHEILNCRYIGTGSMPPQYATSAQGFIDFANDANKVASAFKKAGYQLVYHNHQFEFQRFNGKLGMDILLEETNEDFQFEIDTYWVQTGGGDPRDWIRKVNGRMDVVHFKDMVIGTERNQMMAEIGEGNLNWAAIIRACREIGVKWYLVEQDICQRDPFESLAISLRYLHRMGIR